MMRDRMSVVRIITVGHSPDLVISLALPDQNPPLRRDESDDVAILLGLRRCKMLGGLANQGKGGWRTLTDSVTSASQAVPGLRSSSTQVRRP